MQKLLTGKVKKFCRKRNKQKKESGIFLLDSLFYMLPQFLAKFIYFLLVIRLMFENVFGF